MNDETPTPLEKLPAHERRQVIVQVAALLIVPTALVILLVMVLAIGLAWQDARERSHDNRALIERIGSVERSQRNAAALLRSQLKRTDVLNCQEIETLKAGFRQDAAQRRARLDETLAVLGIAKTPTIVALADEDLKRAKRRYAGRPGGCGTLPSVRNKD